METVNDSTSGIGKAGAPRGVPAFLDIPIRPWSGSDADVIYGKLSALRWVMGSEWDFLDT